jgi:hypothetical protein
MREGGEALAWHTARLQHADRGIDVLDGESQHGVLRRTDRRNGRHSQRSGTDVINERAE